MCMCIGLPGISDNKSAWIAAERSNGRWLGYPVMNVKIVTSFWSSQKHSLVKYYIGGEGMGGGGGGGGGGLCAIHKCYAWRLLLLNMINKVTFI